jgi:predicted O-methyltransferase YrrM
MHAKFTALTPTLYEYLVAHNPPQDEVLRALAAETAALGPVAMMQIAVEQGAFLTWLARLVEARFAVEIGTFTGYSAISIARGLAPGGRLLSCDVAEEWTAIARRYWSRAGLADRIELRLARYSAYAPRDAVGRSRLHRRRQDELPELLRSAAAAALDPRGDRVRQRALEWIGSRSGGA